MLTFVSNVSFEYSCLVGPLGPVLSLLFLYVCVCTHPIHKQSIISYLKEIDRHLTNVNILRRDVHVVDYA